MTLNRALNLALVCGAAVGLSGCVAAAIPLVAGGAIVRTQTDGEAAPTSSAEPARPQTPQFAELSDEQLALASGAVFVGEAPAPDGFGPTGEHARAVLGLEQVTDYAIAKMDGNAAAATPLSARLADPTSLSPQRAECSGTTPMILIDLDPADALFDAKQLPEPSPADLGALQSFRSKGGFVAWISGQSAVAAGDIRAALKKSGLDAEGKDELLLLRYPGDRKETRREDLASSSCLLAIAGDQRADFDELFKYLSNPDAALGLELLIGDGWFLLPALNPAGGASPDQPATFPFNEETQP